MQATIARRMAEAKSTVPEFQVTVEARVDLAVSLRQQLKDSVPGAEKVTMTDFLVRACALALRKFPEVNSSWADNRFQRKRSINIGLAVAPRQGMRRIVPGKVMRMTLSVDHRVFYGATAARFMAEVKRLIENAVALLMPPA